MNVLIVSTYELGRQPFGVGSAAAWLQDTGATVRCLDLAVEKLDSPSIRWATIVCFYLPMHTATRIAVKLTGRIRILNPEAHLCFFGLYAPVNEAFLRSIGGGTILGGEFESGLVAMLHRVQAEGGASAQSGEHEPIVGLDRLAFRVPDRSGLPELHRYAHLTLPDGSTRVVGYTEASRGCKHLCRHCPIVPVYGGKFRIVPVEIVLADIAQQVGAGAEHITFGDPDFFNGPGHALRIVRALSERWPELSYDVTIKVQHLLQHEKLLPVLRETGCVLLTTAVEALDEHILELLDKRHTLKDLEQVIRLTRSAGIALNPTFVAFTPWTSIDVYSGFLQAIDELGLVESVSPIQYAIRLLIPEGSRLLELQETQAVIQPFDPTSLAYPWTHPDPRVDRLQLDVLTIVQHGISQNESRRVIYERVVAATEVVAPRLITGGRSIRLPAQGYGMPAVPHLSEPWYC